MQGYTSQKDKGNNLFKQKKFQQSIQVFQATIDEMLKQHPQQISNSNTQFGKLFVVLNINAAFGALSIKSKEFYIQAERYCNHALKIDPKNQKGLFRRGLANKELAELLEMESKGTNSELIGLYQKAKKDFEQVAILDRTNDLAQKKLSEVVKNIYRVTVSQGKQVNFSSKKEEVKELSSTSAEEKKQTPKTIKKGGDMNKILQEYKIDQVTTLARTKIQNQYLNQQLPRTRAELEKAIREISKSEDAYIKFLYRMNEEYLNKVDPTFDMLFDMTNHLIKKGQGDQAANTLISIKKQKAFDLLWKSYTGGEKKTFKEKWAALGLNQSELK